MRAGVQHPPLPTAAPRGALCGLGVLGAGPGGGGGERGGERCLSQGSAAGCPGSSGCAHQPPASQPAAVTSIPLPSRAPVVPGVFWRNGKMKRTVEARPALSPGLPTLRCCRGSPETLGLCRAFTFLRSPAAAFLHRAGYAHCCSSAGVTARLPLLYPRH